MNIRYEAKQEQNNAKTVHVSAHFPHFRHVQTNNVNPEKKTNNVNPKQIMLLSWILNPESKTAKHSIRKKITQLPHELMQLSQKILASSTVNPHKSHIQPIQNQVQIQTTNPYFSFQGY